MGQDLLKISEFLANNKLLLKISCPLIHQGAREENAKCVVREKHAHKKKSQNFLKSCNAHYFNFLQILTFTQHFSNNDFRSSLENIVPFLKNGLLKFCEACTNPNVATLVSAVKRTRCSVTFNCYYSNNRSFRRGNEWEKCACKY
jgi:hypothetical protein